MGQEDPGENNFYLRERVTKSQKDEDGLGTQKARRARKSGRGERQRQTSWKLIPKSLPLFPGPFQNPILCV
jgi:hypothetical protein